MNRKLCPLLIQSETNPSMTIEGQSWTRTYMLECIGEKCAAYNEAHGTCERFYTSVKGTEAMKDGIYR